jgi:hypothetical protein
MGTTGSSAKVNSVNYTKIHQPTRTAADKSDEAEDKSAILQEFLNSSGSRGIITSH